MTRVSFVTKPVSYASSIRQAGFRIAIRDARNNFVVEGNVSHNDEFLYVVGPRLSHSKNRTFEFFGWNLPLSGTVEKLDTVRIYGYIQINPAEYQADYLCLYGPRDSLDEGFEAFLKLLNNCIIRQVSEKPCYKVVYDTEPKYVEIDR